MKRASIVAARALSGGLLAGLALGASAAPAHVHGVAALSISVDGQDLRVLLDAPMEVMVGFEHAPRTAAERQAVERAREALARPALLQPNAEAGCAALRASGIVEGGVSRQAGHADLAQEFAFRCAQPRALRSLDLGLFEAFPRLQRIEAVIVSGNGQAKRTVQRPLRNLLLVR